MKFNIGTMEQYLNVNVMVVGSIPTGVNQLHLFLSFSSSIQHTVSRNPIKSEEHNIFIYCMFYIIGDKIHKKTE